MRGFGRWLASDELFTTGSSRAFYAMLLLPPMILIALWVVGSFVPDVVRGVVDVATRAGALSVAAAIWPATADGAALAVFWFGPELLGSTGVALQVAAAAALAFTLLVALVFALFHLPDTTPSDLAVGALTASGLQVLVTGGYVLYLETVADLEATYGPSQLAVTVLLGLWLLLSNAVLLVSYRVMLRRCHRRQERTA